jgi:hypothetical protein
MLRILGRTVARLWETRPADATVIHLHHIDPGYEPVHQEIMTRLGLLIYGSEGQQLIRIVKGVSFRRRKVLPSARIRNASCVTHRGQPPLINADPILSTQSPVTICRTAGWADPRIPGAALGCSPPFLRGCE